MDDKLGTSSKSKTTFTFEKTKRLSILVASTYVSDTLKKIGLTLLGQESKTYVSDTYVSAVRSLRGRGRENLLLIS